MLIRRTAALLAACMFGLAWGVDEEAESVTLLPAIDVTAGFDAMVEQRYASGARIVIDQAEIAALGGLSVAEVLRRLPGLERAGAGVGGAAAAGARGMARDAVVILVNGERPSASGRHALTLVGRLPAGELERIEILRGASAEYGSDAAVVVNLVVKAPPRIVTKTLRAVAGVRGDALNTHLTAGVGGAQGGFSWTLPVTVNRHRMPVEAARLRTATDAAGSFEQRESASGAYVIDEAVLSPRLSWAEGSRRLTLWPSFYDHTSTRRQRVERTDRIAGGAGVVGGYAGGSSGLGLNVAGTSGVDVGVAGVGAGPGADGRAVAGHSRRDERERGSVRIARLRVDAETALAGDAKLGVRLAWMDGERVLRTMRRRDIGDMASALVSERGARGEREANGALRWDRPLGGHLLSAGLEAADFARRERQDSDHGGMRVVGAQDLRERRHSLWVQDEWLLEDTLTLTAGLRADAMRQRTDAGRRRHRALDPSLALRWEPAEAWVLRASAGSAIRLPKLDELSALVTRSADANTPLEADQGGNPALRAERITRLELGAERFVGGERAVLGANLYRQRTRHFIERRSRLEDGRWVERPDNVGTAHHWGVELSARTDTARLGRAMPAGGTLRATLTLPRAHVEDTRLGVRWLADDTPRHLATLAWEHAPAQALTGYGMQLRHAAWARSARAAELRGRSGAGTRVDAHITRRIAPGVTLRLSGENLLGTRERLSRSARFEDRAWHLHAREGGERTWLVSLDGKW
jgi:iron complex outermembrane receptor protein